MEENIEGGKTSQSNNIIQDKVSTKLRKDINMEAFKRKRVKTKMCNTTGLKCRTCGSSDIYVESKQVRSADEATTKFYECLNCGATWSVN